MRPRTPYHRLPHARARRQALAFRQAAAKLEAMLPALRVATGAALQEELYDGGVWVLSPDLAVHCTQKPHEDQTLATGIVDAPRSVIDAIDRLRRIADEFDPEKPKG